MPSSIPFQHWLHTMIDWDGMPTERWVIINHFVKYALLPTITAAGYTIQVPLATLKSRLATGLWLHQSCSHLESDWSQLRQYNNNEYMDHLWNWGHVMDNDAWDQFWSRWGNWEDVNPELSSRAADRRADIQDFIWSQIDLSLSAQTKSVEDFIDYYPVESSGQGGAGTTDTYLREAAESNQYEGRRR